jgi:hypothetical protein
VAPVGGAGAARVMGCPTADDRHRVRVGAHPGWPRDPRVPRP